MTQKQTQAQVAQGDTFPFVIPEGMTKEEALKLFGVFTRNYLVNKKKVEADAAAFRTLIRTHKEELLKLRIEEWKKRGLDPSKLHINNR
jgi:hypothetical protein